MQILDYETKVFKLDETHCKQQRKLIFLPLAIDKIPNPMKK